jgi:small subunit ribosomal protein S4
LRNKQTLKRVYQLSEKQFKRLVVTQAGSYAKNKGIGHDKAVFQFLERRLDAIVLRAGLANTIMQARQIVVHGHLLLNGRKHNVPSYFVNEGDIIEVKKKLQPSALYTTCPLMVGNHTLPSRCKVNKKSLSIEIVGMPKDEEISVPVDILQVIEFYARA